MTDTTSAARDDSHGPASVERVSFPVWLLIGIDNGLVSVGSAIARALIDGFGAYAMAYWCCVPLDQVDARKTDDAENLRERTVSELRALARTARLPDGVLAKNERSDC